jgi:C-terminal processing protease CtpA/Prc
MRWKTMAIGTAALFVLSANLQGLAQRPVVAPTETYHGVWRIVKEQYYDRTYNSQDWTILRNTERRHVLVTRSEIPIHGVSEAMMLDDKIGYVRINTLISGSGMRYIEKALGNLRQAQGIVLDLRDNAGGLLTNAIGLADLFLENGIIVSTVDRTGKIEPVHSKGSPSARQALVVLVNEGTANTAEIAAAALQANRRAEIVGQRTFGKGLVQNITKLTDGSGVNLSIARYVAPDNKPITDGITPDHEILISKDRVKDGHGPWFATNPNPEHIKDGNDLQLAKALEVRGAKLKQPSVPTQYAGVEDTHYVTTVRSNIMRFFSDVVRKIKNLAAPGVA